MLELICLSIVCFRQGAEINTLKIILFKSVIAFMKLSIISLETNLVRLVYYKCAVIRFNTIMLNGVIRSINVSLRHVFPNISSVV